MDSFFFWHADLLQFDCLHHCVNIRGNWWQTMKSIVQIAREQGGFIAVLGREAAKQYKFLIWDGN